MIDSFVRLLVLAILVTSPDFQGRGVGRRLCQEGLRIADGEKLPAWLEASALGRKLYKKLGFEDVQELSIDLSKYGGEGIDHHLCMLRASRKEM